MVDNKLELYALIETIIKNENEINGNDFTWTPEALTSFTNLLTSYIKISATDLESFARHAKRSTINPEDVKLLCRRNAGLESILSEFISKK